MEVWLFYVILCLLMDIVGIWLLAKPLLRIVFRNEDAWNKRLQEILDEHKLEIKNYEGRKEGEVKSTDAIPMWFDFTQLRAYVYIVYSII